MGASYWVQLGAAFLSGPALQWIGKIALRAIRGDGERLERRQDAVADRQERRETADAKRESAELERLVTEISRLSLERKDREALVDLLRHELDKALVRGNSTLTMARILLAAVDAEEKPSRQMIAAREQARDVLNAADEQIKRGN